MNEGYRSAGQAAQLDWPLTESYEICQGESHFDPSHMQASLCASLNHLQAVVHIVVRGEKPVANNWHKKKTRIKKKQLIDLWLDGNQPVTKLLDSF